MRVSKETAVLLKDAGYDVACEMCYDKNGDLQRTELGDCNFNESRYAYSAPTLHEAADWLRSKGVHVSIYPNVEWQEWMWNVVVKNEYTCDGELRPTFDSAYEAGIVHGLKYIK